MMIRCVPSCNPHHSWTVLYSFNSDTTVLYRQYVAIDVYYADVALRQGISAHALLCVAILDGCMHNYGKICSWSREAIIGHCIHIPLY